MTITQICNVGQICGGTAACAWSITRALPGHNHQVFSRSTPTRETIEAFDPVPIRHIEESKGDAPDFLILHNQTHQACIEANMPTLAYVHSKAGHPAPKGADFAVYCSEWLAAQCSLLFDPGLDDLIVMHQGVPVPPILNYRATELLRETRDLQERAIIGRICTPQARKWPEDLTLETYSRLALRFPNIHWEFVGCPTQLQARLRQACGGRTQFHNASWQARGHLHYWDAMLYWNPHLPESFGRTCAEAMLAGCFPLMQPIGGVQEQIPPDACWALANSKFTALENAIANLLNADPDVIETVRKDMVAYARKCFGLAPFGDRLKAIIARTITAHRARQGAHQSQA